MRLLHEDPDVTAPRRGITADLPSQAIQALPAGEIFRLSVRGTSMTPVLLDGDQVLAERAGGWRPGDILVVDLPDAGLVVHRVLWTTCSVVRTRGDGSGRMDVPVPRARVLGRVVEIRRDGQDVSEGAVVRRLEWLRHLAAAAWHRIGRRIAGAAKRGVQQ